MEDMRRRKQLGKKESKWECKRKEYYTSKGYAEEEIQSLRQRGWKVEEIMAEKDIAIQKQEDYNHIERGIYNKRYIRVIGRPQYLSNHKTDAARTVARFRCGNVERGNRYWEELEYRKCRICGEEDENIEHWLQSCDGLREDEMTREEILQGDGRGLQWMESVLKEIRKAN